MFRAVLYVLGVSACITAWALYRNQSNTGRRVPVTEAAAKLQEAWADNHTVA